MTTASATTSPPTSPAAMAQRMDELKRIILAYSDVTEKLQQSQEQLKRQVAHLHEQLSEKNRLLERRNRLAALGEMAAGMAHEIRNPLGGIQLYASLLARDVADRPECAERVAKIRGGVRHLEALVSQVLHFTRELRVNAEPCDLAEIVEQAVDLTERQRGESGVTLHLDGPATLPVTVDSLLIGQVILNLLLNAVEAMASAPGERCLWVQFAPPSEQMEARQFQLVVRDSGPGIDPTTLDQIFNPFFTTKDTGTGLGLAIVHRVIEAHDGTIRASNHDGGGARFEVRI